MAIKVTLDDREYRLQQRVGFVLIYRRNDKPFGRSLVVWDSRKHDFTVGSIAARVISRAARRATITFMPREG